MVIAIAAGDASTAWNVTKFAEPLALLATLLAGLVFASIAILMATPPKRSIRTEFSSTVYVLFVVFVSFIASAFFFSVIQAFDATAGRSDQALLMGMLASYCFWITVILMAVSIMWLCREYDLDTSTMGRVRLLFHILLVLVALCLGGTAAKISQELGLGDGLWLPWTSRVGAVTWFISISLLALVVLPELAWSLKVEEHLPYLPSLETTATYGLLLVGLAGVCFAAILLLVQDGRDVKRFGDEAVIYLPLIGLWVFITMLGLHLPSAAEFPAAPDL